MSRHPARRLSVLTMACVLGLAAGADAQPAADSADAPVPPPAVVQVPVPPSYDNPWMRRPVCSSMFLENDWQLSAKQRLCDLTQNRLFSMGSIAGALVGAGVSQVRDAASERGDGFGTRFSRRLAQDAAKAVASFAGAVIAGADPRRDPPFMILRADPAPRGFWRRTGHALFRNVVSYRCGGTCSSADDIHKRPALSHVTGALASGYAAEAWTWDRENSHHRALRGAATAYGGTFLGAVVHEFKPELSAAAARTFRMIFAPR